MADKTETPEQTEPAKTADQVTLSRADHDTLRRQLREAKEAAERATSELTQLKSSAQEEQGQYKQLYEDEKAAHEKTKGELTDLQGTVSKDKQSRLVEKAAKAAGFRDPEDAISFLSEEDLASESTIDAAVKRVKEEKGYLISDSPPVQRTVEGNGAPAAGGDIDSAIRQAAGRA